MAVRYFGTSQKCKGHLLTTRGSDSCLATCAKHAIWKHMCVHYIPPPRSKIWLLTAVKMKFKSKSTTYSHY